jgi:4-hydroxybenzoate polyprenyltransferase
VIAIRRAFTMLGYLAVWNALYAAALLLAATQLLDLAHEPFAIAGAFFMALGVFLLDRVKPRDSLLDPADEAANPARFAFHRAHARTLRALIVISVLTGAACMLIANRPIAAILAVLSPVGVLVYGTLRPPTGVRLKDRPIRKNLSVALALAYFAMLIALGPTLRLSPSIVLDRAPAELCVFAWIVLVVFADAALCDLDDAESDKRFGTRTLANTLAARRLWLLALVAQILSAPFAFWGAALSGASAPLVVAWWAIAPPLSLVILRAIRPARVRDLIDARFALIGLVALLLEWLTR